MKQLIVSEFRDRESIHSEVRGLILREDGSTEPVWGPWPAVNGRRGLGKEKEGDLRSPAGVFRITGAFGHASAESLADLRLPYFSTLGEDIWVDDPESPDYNRHVRCSGDPGALYRSFERLRIPEYLWALTLDFNAEGVAGVGSAIFLHVWKGPDTATAGCTALSAERMEYILHWLDAGQDPHFIQGLQEDVSRMIGTLSRR